MIVDKFYRLKPPASLTSLTMWYRQGVFLGHVTYMMVVHESIITLDKGPLYLCDMRLGPTEDGICVELPRGYYGIHHKILDDGTGAIRIIEPGIVPDHVEPLGPLSTELNYFGLFDRGAVLGEFGSFEDLYEWGDSEVYGRFGSEVFDVTTPKGLKIHCFRVGENEAEHSIIALYNSERLIGIEILISDTRHETELAKSKAVIYRVEIKYGKVELEVYLFSEFDGDAVSDTLRDSILDHIYPSDDIRLEQIVNDSEPNFGFDVPLGEVDKRFLSITEFRVHKRIGTTRESLFYEATAQDDLPANTIVGIAEKLLGIMG